MRLHKEQLSRGDAEGAEAQRIAFRASASGGVMRLAGDLFYELIS
jgi:hypothetical protein